MIAQNPYNIRNFNLNNPSDVERMNLMYYHPEVMRAMSYENPNQFMELKLGDLQSFDKLLFTTPEKVSRKDEDLSYAVSDTQDKLVGWIWFCIDKCHPLPVKVTRKYGFETGKIRSYQIVYEKLLSDSWPNNLLRLLKHTTISELTFPRKGVIVEGLRLAINKLQRSYRKLYKIKKNIALYAYVLPDNLASQKVLMKNGFRVENREYKYDGVSHLLWVRII